MKRFKPGDFLKLRDFSVKTYCTVGKRYNWTLERWNFSVLARTMHGISASQWEDTVGIWEEEGEILSVVNSEGEGAGEAYFQTSTIPLPPEVIEEMFAFAEQRLAVKRKGAWEVNLRIPAEEKIWEKMAEDRGFEKTDRTEKVSYLPIEKRPRFHLPEGFKVVTGDDLTARRKALAHGRAFEYLGTKYVDRATKGFELLQETPDYRPGLDLWVVDEKSREVVSFCGLWFDEINAIGILEPVGTAPEFRRRGLARAAIGEGLRRMARLGATRAYVGSAAPFYSAVGFKPLYTQRLWRKRTDSKMCSAKT